MPEFAYTALGNTGQRSEGTLTANSEREVMTMLDARGLYPLKIEEAQGAVATKAGGGKVKARHMSVFYSQLADLLRAGVPLLRSLEILERQSATPALSATLKEVRAKVADGTSLGDAMAIYPRAFNELAISMVRAGQEGGFLEDVLERIAQFTEHQEDLKSKVIGALAYPIFLAVAGFTVLTILIVFFVPKFEPIFEKLREKNQMPELTEWLILTSHAIQGWWWLIGGVVVGLWMLYRRWARTEQGRLTMDRWRLRMPTAGKIYLSFAWRASRASSARCCTTAFRSCKR